MRCKLNIAIMLSLVFLAGPARADVCSADLTQTLVSCVDTYTENSPLGASFTQWYEVENKCGYDIRIVIDFDDGQRLTYTLYDGEKDGSSLPEGMQTTGFYCCSSQSDCKID